MTSDSTLDLEAQWQAQHDYSPDADNTALVSDYESGISALDLTTADEATIDALIEQNQNQIGFNFGGVLDTTGLADTALSIGLFTAGSGLKTVAAATDTLISDLGGMSGTDTIEARMASWITTNISPGATIGAEDLVKVADFMTERAADIAVFSAVSEVLHSDNPTLVGLEQGIGLGVGTAVFAANVPDIATATLAEFAAGAFKAGAASAVVLAAETAFNDTVAYGQAHSWSVSAIAAAVESDFDSQYATMMSSTGSDATTNLATISTQAAAIADALGNLGPDLSIAPDIAAAVTSAAGQFGDAEIQSSPLMIDLSSGHTGISLTAYDASTTSTFFDIDGTGFASQTAWTSGSTTGFLVDDLNSNGKIDSVSEMFGSSTVDGFAQLAALDTNHDLKIDSNDAAWSSLQIWIDANGDGITQSGELHSLSSLGIVSIDLAGVAPSTDTIEGNTVSHTSTVTFSDASTSEIADVWLTHSTTNTYYNGDYSLDTDALSLPDLRGYGTLPDLTIAMSMDSTLKGLVSDFAGGFTLDSLADPSTLNSDITNILYQWAGVESVDPTSREPYTNAQNLEFLEHLLGQSYNQFGDSQPSPLGDQSIESAFHTVFDAFKADLLVQTEASTLFDGPVTYNPWTGTLTSDIHLSETGITALATHAPGTEGPAEAFWVGIADFIDSTEGISNLTTDEQTWLDTAVSSTTTIGWTDIVTLYEASTAGSTIDGTSGNDTLTGGSGDDTIYGNGGSDTIDAGNGNNFIQGNTGNDVFTAGDGNDTIQGSAGGDDIYHPGTGGNILDGGTGNDTYYFQHGADYIYDTGGTDQIIMPSGVTAGDLTFTRIETTSPGGFDDLLITVASGGSIQVQQHFAGGDHQVETIVFSDTSTLDLTTLTGYHTILSAGDDSYDPGGSIAQAVYGMDGNDNITTGSGNDVIDGGNGNDYLSGGDGDDTYIASPGFDTIVESAGTDTINVPVGFDSSDVTFSRHIGGSGPDNDLIIDIRGLGEIDIQYQFISSSYAVEYLHFLGDSSTISLLDQTIQTIGTTGDDFLIGLTTDVGGNYFDGRGGNDTFYAGADDNTFAIAKGFGTNIIENLSSGVTNAIHFSGVDPADIRMWTDSSGSLHLQDMTDASHSITVYAGITGSGSDETAISTYLQQVTFDDIAHTVWDMTGGLNLQGDDSGDSLYGTAYNDTIAGGSGSDIIFGNGGDDQLIGGGGSNYIDGGTGTNTVDYSNATSGVTVDLSSNAASDNGMGGSDTLYNIQNVTGSSHADTITGDSHDNVLYGNGGNDSLTGGLGADTFLFKGATAFTGSATITDFTTGQGDKIDIADVLHGHYNPATDAIADFVQLTTSGSNTLLKVDLDGTGGTYSPTTIATLDGVTGLSLSTLIADHHLIVPT